MSKRGYAVDISTVEAGDHISVAWKHLGVAHVAVGKVGSVEYLGSMRVLVSNEGGTIISFNPRESSQYLCTMLERYVPAGPALFELED